MSDKVGDRASAKPLLGEDAEQDLPNSNGHEIADKPSSLDLFNGKKRDHVLMTDEKEDLTNGGNNGVTKVTLSPSDNDALSSNNGHTPSLANSLTTSLGKHLVKLEEVAPSASSIVEDPSRKNEWQMSLNVFSSKKRGKQKADKKLPRSIRRFYKMQDEIIEAFEDMQLDVDDAMENTEIVTKNRHLASILSRVSFVVNLCLLIMKSIVGGMTGSLSIISAVVDSAVDLVSGALMWWSNRAMKTRDIYQYPQGRTKLEPIAIVVLSVIMASASIQVMREAIEQMVSFALFDLKGPPPFNESGVLCVTLDEMYEIVAEGTGEGPEFTIFCIAICIATVVVKLILFLVCRRVDNASVQALAQDHRNDVLSNSVALLCGLLGGMLWKYADPLGAVVISLYIIVSWFMTGWEQIKMLTGHTARPDFLKKITWIALNHHSKVKLIDTVRAFHFGNNFLVEVDIVLPEDMSMRESHDIGESLQLKIERLPEVERAFVHLDYECEHHPWSEHKQV